MNNRILKKFNFTQEQYLNWCKQNKLPHYKRQTQVKFFEKILAGKINFKELSNENDQN